MTKILELLETKSRLFIAGLGIALVLLIGIPDYLLAPGISFSIFYLIPVSLTAWFAGARVGIFISLLGAGTWLAADLLSATMLRSLYVPYWNAAVRFGFFVIVVMLLNTIKREKTFARVDYLTSLGNRRYFFELAELEMNRVRRYDHAFTLAYIDIDNFKSVNDRFGHDEGDALLKAVARVIRRNIRAGDVAARLGGDEFSILVPESTPESAKKFIGKLHRRLSDTVARKWPVTFSIGVITFRTVPASIDEMIKYGDELMYSAKSSGKDLVRYEIVG